MNRDVKVTVYCAAYNHEPYIREALDGFVMQKTSFDFEVLVHDDASTDKTAEIIREYEENYPEIIKPIYQAENQYSQGVNRVYTWLLPRTRGKYVAICEGDDYWTDPYKLQKQYDYMEAHPSCSLVAHLAETLYTETGLCMPYTSLDFSAPERCSLDAPTLIRNHLIFPTAAMFFRTDYYTRNAEFLLSIKTYDYVNKILLASEGEVHVIPEVMSVYRQGVAGSWTNRIQADPKKFEQHMELSVHNLTKINEYTSYRFDEAIQKSIVKRRFDAYYALGRLQVLKREPYAGLYRSLTPKQKAFLYMKRYTPHLAAFVDKTNTAIKRKKK